MHTFINAIPPYLWHILQLISNVVQTRAMSAEIVTTFILFKTLILASVNIDLLELLYIGPIHVYRASFVTRTQGSCRQIVVDDRPVVKLLWMSGLSSSSKQSGDLFIYSGYYRKLKTC